jgi:hypothetical protein
VFNDAGADVDFRVEGDTDANLLFVDASADKVGFGTSSPSDKVTIQGTSTGSTVTNISNFSGLRINGSLGDTGVTGITFQDGGGGGAAIGLARGGGFNTDIRFYTNPSSTTTGGATTERMRIEDGGSLLVGTTSPPDYGSKLRVQGNIETQGSNQFNIVATSSVEDFEWVLRTGSRQLYYVTNGTIVANLSAVGVWTNASDARYKENIVDSQYGLSTVMALKPRSYNLIDQADKPQVGFIAQEVIDVVPEVVESTHNSVTGQDRYTLSYGNLVAVLTKAIQEQQAIIEQLKARLDAANL